MLAPAVSAVPSYHPLLMQLENEPLFLTSAPSMVRVPWFLMAYQEFPPETSMLSPVSASTTRTPVRSMLPSRSTPNLSWSPGR